MQTSVDNAAVVDETVAPAHQDRAQRGRMLVMENAECVGTTVDGIKSWMDMDVETAENGRIACILAMISLAEGRPYDVILIDMQIQMPTASGVEAVEWLRQHGWQGPILAMGVDVSAADRARFLATGCDGFIDKPLTDKRLLAAFAQLVGQNDGVAPTAPAEHETPSVERKKVNMLGRVLVVEDAICVQMIVGAFLQKMNFEVDTADNGRTACEMAVQSLTDRCPYDVILMDIQMPKMNGKKAAKWLRENGWTGPIIAVSIHATDRNREEFLKAGCDSYLSKPITEASLRNVLSECLHPEPPSVASEA